MDVRIRAILYVRAALSGRNERSLVEVTDFPECPLFESLVAELGSDVVFDRYFDDNNDVVDDAPQQLKDEIANLRAEVEPTPYGVRR